MDDKHEQSKTWYHKYVHEEPAKGREREREGEITSIQKLETVACLRLSVKSLFQFDDIHRTIENSIPIVIPILYK